MTWVLRCFRWNAVKPGLFDAVGRNAIVRQGHHDNRPAIYRREIRVRFQKSRRDG